MATKNLNKIFILIFIILSIIFTACSQPKQEVADTDTNYHDSLIIELAGSDSLSVLEILKQNHKVTTKATALGEFVTGIDSISISDGYFWLFTVNDTMSQIACDKMIVNKSDYIKWYFRK